MRRQLSAFGILFFFLTFFLGITTGAFASNKNVLTVLVPAEFPHLDPFETVSGDQYMVKYHVYNRLYTFTEEMKPVPDVVTKDSVSQDGKTWTFDIRPGVKFHDGTPLDSAAVKYTIERQQQSTGNQKALFAMIESVEVKSPTRLEVRTKGLFPALRNQFAHPDGGIVSPTADKKLGKNFGKEPVGAGPYVFKKWQTGDHLTLVRNEQYYGEKPYFEQIDFKFVPDATTRVLMMETGQADVSLRLPPSDISRLDENQNVKVLQILGRNVYYTLNIAKTPFDDQRVRKAVNYAVDKEAICKKVLFNSAQPSHSLVEAVYGTINAGYYEYSPEKAKALIDDAGAKGAKILLMTPTNRYMLDSEVSQAVAGYLRQVGLDVEVRAVGDWPSFTDAARRGDFSMHMLGWGGSTGDPDNAFRIQLHSNNAGKIWNAGSYRNPKVDKLIEEASKEFDIPKRAQKYAEIQKLVWDDAPWLFMYRLSVFIAHDAKIEGIRVLPGTEMPFFWHAKRIK